jgi:hypothetical protein
MRASGGKPTRKKHRECAMLLKSRETEKSEVLNMSVEGDCRGYRCS